MKQIFVRLAVHVLASLFQAKVMELRVLPGQEPLNKNPILFFPRPSPKGYSFPSRFTWQTLKPFSYLCVYPSSPPSKSVYKAVLMFATKHALANTCFSHHAPACTISQMGHIRADVDHTASQELPCSQIGLAAHFPEYPKADGLSLTSLNVLDYMTHYPKTALPLDREDAILI